jgi:hypothetical protein
LRLHDLREEAVTGPRVELPCGCVADTFNGERVWIVRCDAHPLDGEQRWWSSVYDNVETLRPGPDVHDEHGQLVQRFVLMGDLMLPVNRMRLGNP